MSVNCTILPDSWGYNDPGDNPDPFDPFEPDEYIEYLIETGQAPPMEAVV